MQMKDVAGKLNGWQNTELVPGTNVGDLVKLQLDLQKYFFTNSNGRDGKVFPNYENISQWTERQKVFWTKQNLLRIFDEIAEYNEWIDHFVQQKASANVRDNRLFELVDSLHFLFNIVSIWGIRGQVKSLQDYTPCRSRDVFFYTMRLNTITSQMLNCLPWKHWKSKTPVEVQKMTRFINKFVEQVLNCFVSLRLTKDDVYKMYFAKNKENIERQKRGY